MSVDAHELERAALQKKDREQLQAIARAMGGRPSSRARKDQIIDLIMGLAGGPVPSPSLFADAGGDADAAAGTEPGATTRAGAEMAATFPADDASRVGGGDRGDDIAGNGRTRAAGGPEDPSSTPEHAASELVPDSAAADPGGGTERRDPAENGQRTQPSTARFVFSPDDPGPNGGDDLDDDPRPVRNRPTDDRPGRPAYESQRSSVESNGPGRAGGLGVDTEGDADGGGDGAAGARSVDLDAQGEGAGRRRRRRGKDRERTERNDRFDRGEGREGQGPRPVVDDPSVQEPVAVAGFLDLRDEGYGFLRVRGLLPSKEDVYVPSKFVRQFSLRKGDRVEGSSRPAGRGEKNPALLRVDAINGQDPERSRSRTRFEDLTPLFPDEKLRLERADDPSNMTARIIDLIAPIGKGQRGLIVSPPKAGKTTIMKQIAQSIEANNPEVRLIVLLVDERPEEVTDMRRSVQGEVVASTFDRPADEHTAVAELTIERAKRMVELGEDVVIILDGITRLARAYNLAAPATGRIMSGGIDTGALYPPKKFFGAARNTEEGGSLTILATALVETGSRMDEVIFEEFKGTGNMELRLDRKMSEKRIYPAIDVDASSTRHEELLFERRQLQMVWKLRRVLSGLAESNAGLELLVDRMKTFRSNDEFLAEVAKAPSM